jgi:glycosyltransferase involved in cell wall biosynthesis
MDFPFARVGDSWKLDAVPVTLALSLLCENPRRPTGLTTLFHGFVAEALRQFPDVNWVLFAGPEQPWKIADPRVEVVRTFPANDHRLTRLWADHFRVGPEARRRGALALLTVGFGPLRTAGLPVAMHVFALHHLRTGGGAGAMYRRAAVARGLKRAELIITNSEWTAAHLVARGRKIVSPEGLDHQVFRPDGVAGGEGLPAAYLLWVSNFYPYKRAELALAAFARLPPELRAKFPLVLVGGDWNGGKARAEAVARELGIAADVRFLGWVEDAALPALYRGARAHVLPTAEETFGKSVTEAMACGCPCVLHDLPVLREVANDAAVFVDFADSTAAGEALRRICTDDGLAAGMRTAGLKRAADFSYARLARERVGAVLEMLGNVGVSAVAEAMADKKPRPTTESKTA